MVQPDKHLIKITNSIQYVRLQYAIEDAKHISIEKITYTTASTGNRTMMVRIGGYDNNIYYDGDTFHKYTAMIVLPTSTDTQSLYEKYSNRADGVTQNTKGFTDIKIEVLIEGQHTADISPTNPVFIELRFF